VCKQWARVDGKVDENLFSWSSFCTQKLSSGTLGKDDENLFSCSSLCAKKSSFRQACLDYYRMTIKRDGNREIFVCENRFCVLVAA
jgi:hypothetical protein